MALVEERLNIGESEETMNFLDFFNQSPVEEEYLSAVRPRTAKFARAPKVLQNDESFKEVFEPKFVSIGPYHHGNPNLQAAEDLKKKLARHFVSYCRKPATTMYYELYNEINQIRYFYENELTGKYNDEELTRILFVDGCFLLYVIYSYSPSAEHCNLKNISDGRVILDTCLLENQLPFLVLKLLGENNFEKWPGLIVWYIESICKTLIPIKERRKEDNSQPEDSSHLVQLLQIELKGSCEGKRDVKYYFPPRPYYSVTQLSEVGIHCKPSQQGDFKSARFSPHWFYGILELPSMVVGPSTKKNLLNLIAYEMHPDVHEFEVQSYIFFLASILRQPQDVKALREARILYSYFGSDEEVMQMFKEIDAKLSQEKILGHFDILMQISSYLDRRRRTKIAAWLVEVFNVYFRSPWSTVTVLAGFLALSATIIQTILQIVSNK